MATRGPAQYARIAALPEMRFFWFSLPFLVAEIVVGIAASLSTALLTASIVICVLVGAAIFFVSYQSATARLDEARERNELRSIVLNLDDAVMVYDKNFTVLFFNPAAEKLFRVSTSAVVGRAVHPKDAEDPKLRLLAQVVYPSLAPVLVPRTESGDYPQVADLSFDNPPLELRLLTAPVNDRDGNVTGFMKVVKNRTRELLLLKSKAEFISIASHQFRTPISELQWAMELLAKDPNLNGDSKTLAENTLKSVRALSELVENLLNISRIEEGRFGYNFEPADIVEFLGKLLGTALPQVERAGLTMYFDRPEEPLPRVTIDPQKISMVISNLLDNAIRYNLPNGTITVAVKSAAEGPFIEIIVKDTGIGVPADQTQKLFMKFFRAENATKYQTEGSGLGLYIAQNIVRAHGGRMWAESELNRGTTFHLTLPTDVTLVPTKEVALEY